MIEVREEVNVAKNKTPRVRKGQINKQKESKIMQKNWILSDLQDNTYNFERRTSCNHHYVLPFGIDTAEIHWINENARIFCNDTMV